MERDSQGNKIHSGTDNTIEFIGAQGLEPQPVVLGDNLVNCLDDIYGHVLDNTLKIDRLLTEIMKLRLALARHDHVDPISGITFQSVTMIKQLKDEIFDDLEEFGSSIIDKFSIIRNRKLQLSIPNRGEYILSKHVFNLKILSKFKNFKQMSVKNQTHQQNQ